MKIVSSEFILSAVKEAQFPKDDLPEFAFIGRSNVGKSSLINKLVQRKNLARISQQPGKTQTLNFYLINDSFYFVDLPGYGYAKVSKKQRAEFGEMIQDYLETRADLHGLVILVDSRHDPTVDDINMYGYAQYLKIPILVVATKIDKIKKSQVNQVEKKVGSSLDLSKPGVTFLPVSSLTGYNINGFWDWLEANL